MLLSDFYLFDTEGFLEILLIIFSQKRLEKTRKRYT